MASVQTSATAREIVAKYAEMNFRLVFWKGDGKGPYDKAWGAKAAAGYYTLDKYEDGDQTGILTGTEVALRKFLSDADIDWSPGAEIAKALLPATGCGWGREGKPFSHFLYTTPEPLPSRKFEDPIDKTTLIELRGTKKDGDVGLQSMAPPSVWSKDGKREPLQFVRFGVPAFVPDAQELPRRVCLAAIGMLLAKHLGHNGFGHETRLAWAGFLLRAGIAAADVVTMGEAMSIYCNNREVHDVRVVVESTAENLKSDKKRIKGAPSFAKILGEHGKKIVACVYEWLGHDGDAVVVMSGGRLSEIVDHAEAALLSGSASPIYQRGGVLTRAVKLDAPVGDYHDVRRERGATVLVPVNETWLTEQMGRVLRWLKINAKDERVPADPAPLYARTLLARGQWTFSVLRGVLNAPTLARDGRIIEVPGFDAASGLLLDFPAGSFPEVPPSPSREDAYLALARLSHPLRGFPFVDPAAKAVALSALLTALVRASMRTCPLHGFDAPAAGTGKSMAAENAGLLATGTRPPALSQGKTAEEDEKRLATVLFAGDPVIHIDNCERAIAGDFLCSMLTQEVVQARILGLSERRVLPSTALVLASGNNLTFAGDVTRRAVVCRLDANVERPDAREFDFDCHAEVLAARPELVVAGLTVLRAYHCAGRPVKLTPMGSFTDWEWIRGALVWLDHADPADTRLSILDGDPRKDELLGVMDLWAQAFGCSEIEVGQIDNAQGEAKVALRARLVEAACRAGQWNSKSVGWWLRRHKDRVVGGKAFRCRKGESGMAWSLAGADEAAQAEAFEVGF